jgi:serine/threonine-protein kinase
MPAAAYCTRCLTHFSASAEQCVNLSCKARRPLGGWGQLLEEGDLIDRRYRVARALALGGAGVAYRAREIDDQGAPFGPDLAVKVLHAQRDGGPFLRRLATEAQILRDLAHEHIVQCLGFVHRDGHSPYLVTRFEAGGNLEEGVERLGPIPPWTAAGILRQVAEALHVAHQRGIVHRDLKPANLLLHREVPRTEIPHVRVADFGIAKVDRGLSSGLTRQGAFIGTPQYAAPEQFLGEAATPASDVFSLGGVCCFLLTARLPIDMPPDSDLEDYFEALRERLPPSLPRELVRTKAGEQLQAFVRATMAVRAEDRWSIEECAAWLDHVLGLRPEPPASLRPPEPRPRVEIDRTTALRSRAPAADPAPVVAPAPPAAASAAPSRPAPPRSVSASAPTVMREGMSVTARPALDVHAPSPARPVVSRAAAPGPALSLDDLFADRPTTPNGRPAPAPVARPFVRPRSARLLVFARGDVLWSADPTVEMPHPTPSDIGDLVVLMGLIRPSARGSVVAELLRCNPAELARLVQDHRPGGPPLVGRGLCLAAQLLRRREWEPAVRSLLADPDAGVRAAAAVAVGELGEAASLRTLSGLFRDADPHVRAAAARAIARAARAAGRPAVGLTLVSPALDDPDSLVADAAATAQMELEGG